MPEATWWQDAGEWRERVSTEAHRCPGFVGTMLDHDGQQYVVYAAQDPPESMEGLMREAAPRLTVVWRRTPYSGEELGREVQRLLREHRGLLWGGCPRIDGTGIEMMTSDEALVRASDPQAVLGARYPVTVERGGPVIPA